MAKFSQKRFSDDKKTKIITQAKEHIRTFRTSYKDNIEHHKSMTRFINGEQWLEDEVDAFKASSRVYLTCNKIRPTTRQVIGDDSQFKVDVILRNVGDSSDNGQQEIDDEQEQKIYRGLMRNVAYNSNASRIYSNAYKDQIEGGYGAWRVVVEKINGRNELRVRPIINPLVCYWDLKSKNICKTDGEYSGVISYLNKNEFERRYPGFKFPEVAEFTTTSDYCVKWGDEKEIAICEEYRREHYKEKVYTLKNGQEMSEEEFEDAKISKSEVEKIDNVSKSRIVHYKITDHYILEKSETPFKDLPILFAPGYIRNYDGKERTYSYAADARDAQRQLNYIASDIAQWLKITKKTKFMAPAAAIQNFMDQWKNPDHPDACLPWDPSASDGFKPEVIAQPNMPSDLIEQYKRAEQDIQIALGRYEPNQGAPSNETSGIAIYNRAVQGNTSLQEYRDNRNAAIEETGKLILQAIPDVYDDTRSIVITDDEGEDKSIAINSQKFDPNDGRNVIAPTFSNNSYSVEIDVGPSFPMQKAATAKFVLDLITQVPQTASLLAEFIPENIDLPNAEQISSRLRTLVPPQVLAQEINPLTKEQQAEEYMQQSQAQAQTQQQIQSIQQQLAQLETVAKQLDNMKKQQDIFNEHIKTMNDASTNTMNAETNRLNVHQKGIEGIANVQVDMAKANAEVTKSYHDTMQKEMELEKTRNENQN